MNPLDTQTPLSMEQMRVAALSALRKAQNLADTGQEPLIRQAMVHVDIANTLVRLVDIEMRGQR